MNGATVISQHVINTIKSLPKEERRAIANAIARDVILGEDASSSLTPIEAMLFSMIRFYVRQDTLRYQQSLNGIETI